MTIAMLQVLPSLIAAGIATIQQVRTLIASFHPGMTDPELNAVCDLVATGAAAHKALADADMVKPA